MVTAIASWHQQRQRLVEYLVLEVTKDPLGRRVPENDLSGAVRGDDRVVGRFGHRSEMLLACPQRRFRVAPLTDFASQQVECEKQHGNARDVASEDDE